MGARRPKPTGLKERTSVRPNLGLSRLFSAANALVSTQDDKTLKLTDPRLLETNQETPRKTTNVSIASGRPPATDVKPVSTFVPRAEEPSEYGTAVVVSNRQKAKPVSSEETRTQPIAARTSLTKLKKADDQKREISTRTLALFFLVPAIGLLSYAYFTGSFSGFTGSSPQERQSALSSAQIKQRLEFHREETGARLNRERIDVQIDNFKQAPDLGVSARRVKPPNMMDGLPLSGEPNTYTRNPNGDLPYDPTYSEAHTAYGLQEEQNRIEFEKQAQKEWVKDFIANARRDGYDVKIDQFGNVTSKQIPLNQRGPVSGGVDAFPPGQ